MTRYNWELDFSGPNCTHLPEARVFGAAGGEEYTHVYWCDTVTGEICMCLLGADGSPVVDLVRGEIKRIQFYVVGGLRIDFGDAMLDAMASQAELVENCWQCNKVLPVKSE